MQLNAYVIISCYYCHSAPQWCAKDGSSARDEQLKHAQTSLVQEAMLGWIPGCDITHVCMDMNGMGFQGHARHIFQCRNQRSKQN